MEYGFIDEPCLNNMDACTDGVTVTFWTNSVVTSFSVTGLAMGCGKQFDREGYRVEYALNMVFVNAKFSDEKQLAIFSADPTGWVHHGLIIKKGQDPQYVMNGTLMTKFAGSITSATNTVGGSVRLGYYPEPLDYKYFPGKIDDVRLWKVAKCPEFVKYIFEMYKK